MTQLTQRTTVHIVLIAILGFLVYSHTFHVPFHFDDLPNIVVNPNIKNFHILDEHSTIRRGDYYVDQAFSRRFVGYLTFALNYRLHGLDVAGYHAVNIVIHILNALLLYGLVVATFRTPFFQRAGLEKDACSAALLSGLLFAVHPVQTQSVTYIVQRFASLATLFYQLSLFLYIQWRMTIHARDDGRLESVECPSPYRPTPVFLFLTSILSAFLAMKTKEIAFTLPFVLVLYEAMFFEGPIKRRALYLLPFLLTLAIIPLSIAGVDKPLSELIGHMDDATRLATPVSRGDYLFTEFRVIVTYLRLLAFPVRQNLDYDYPLYRSFFSLEVFLSFLVLLLLLGCGMFLLVRSRRGERIQRLAAFGIFWFFITLSVESSAIPIQDVIFEHRLYLPSAGAFMSFSALLWLVMAKRGIYAKRAAIATVVLAVGIFAVAAYQRNDVWRDGFSLWTDVVQKSPFKARGYNNLGDVHYQNGDLQTAFKYFSHALSLDPSYYQACYNIGVIWGNGGDHEKAAEYFSMALTINPEFARGYAKRGVAFMNAGNAEAAAADFRRACDLGDEEGCSRLQGL